MGVDHPGLPMSIAELLREVRRTAKATLQNASIGRAGIRVYDGGWIRIEGGGLAVTGTQTVSGRLEGSGTFDWTGPMNLKGAQSVTGPTTFTGQVTVNGAWTFAGNGQITGNVGLTGDLNVTGGGRIRAGQVTINPSSSGGTIQIGASEIRGGDGGVGIYPGSGAAIITSAAGVRIFSLPTISRSNANNAVVGSLWISATGFLYRVVN